MLSPTHTFACPVCVYHLNTTMMIGRVVINQQYAVRNHMVGPFILCYAPRRSTRSILARCFQSTPIVAQSSSKPDDTINNQTGASAVASHTHTDTAVWLEYCKTTVQQYDPAATLPGRLLAYHKLKDLYAKSSSNRGQDPSTTSLSSSAVVLSTAYFAIRAFWVETGLRFGSTAAVSPNATPIEHLEWWKNGIHQVVFDNVLTPPQLKMSNSYHHHPVLQLLRHLKQKYKLPWSQYHFDQVLEGRRRDLDVKQYDTLAELIRHAQQSCGNLSQLILQSANILPDTHPAAHQAAGLTGICHGLSNALRHSIPTLSTTGKLIVPADLTVKYGVQSPRYLMSALSMGGDTQCQQAMQNCVRDICHSALDHLQQARELRPQIILEQQQNSASASATACLLPVLASESFLQRLEQYDFQLTDRDLRNTGLWQQSRETASMITAFLQSKF